MTECRDCGHKFDAQKCPKCGWVRPFVQIDSEYRINRERMEEVHTRKANEWLMEHGVINSSMTKEERAAAVKTYAFNLMKKNFFKTSVA